MLDDLVQRLETCHALIIAGDVFDRSLPSAEAADLFSSFLGEVKRRYPKLSVLIIPGNHDAPLRLAYGQELFERLGIHIARGVDTAVTTPVLVEDGGLTCACFLLPFLYPGSFCAHDGGILRSQRELTARAAEQLEAARLKALRDGAGAALLAAHLFCRGGKKAESERAFLGQAEEVDIGLFDAFDYVALGHLHRCQRPAQNAWYAGSPLSYSFDEAGEEKCFLSVELENAPVQKDAVKNRPSAQGDLFGGDAAAKKNPAHGALRSMAAYPEKPRVSCAVSRVPVIPLRPLKKLSGPFSYFLKENDSELEEAASAYLEINLDGRELVENAKPLLRERFPYLLLVKQDEARAVMAARDRRTGTNLSAAGFTGAGDENAALLEDFRNFLAEIYDEDNGGQSGKEKRACFKEILDGLNLSEGGAS